MNRIEISLTPPFDMLLSTRIWSRSALEQVDIVENGNYKRAFIRGGRPVLFELHPKGDVDNPSVEMVLNGDIDPEDLAWGMEQARWILNDFAPIKRFYKHAANVDSRLVLLTERFRGLRPLLSPSVFEILVFAIVGQQVNLNFAYQCKTALENRYAGYVEIDGHRWCTGLEPRDFDTASVQEMRELKISRNKALAIIELARAFQMVPIDRTTLSGMSATEIADSLIALRGIGPWTAEYTLIRGLGSVDAFPSGDAGLKNAIKRHYELDHPLDESKIKTFGEKWKPYRSLATWYLWTSLAFPD